MRKGKTLKERLWCVEKWGENVFTWNLKSFCSHKNETHGPSTHLISMCQWPVMKGQLL
jgi:hypothetical protein